MKTALPTPAFIISDAHLGAAPPEAERSLVAFGEIARRSARTVIINGDLFDFWFEWRHVIPRTGYRALATIAQLRDAGIEVVWVAGNHDCWGGETLAREGVSYHVGSWRGTIGPWSALIEHGDGLREVEDAPYRKLRAVLRNRAAVWTFRHLLHPDWASALARRTSHTSRQMRPRDEGEGLRRVAMERLATDPGLDLYVFGHSHAQALEATARGGVLANPGAWMDGPTGLIVSDTGVSLARFDASVTVIAELARPERRHTADQHG